MKAIILLNGEPYRGKIDDRNSVVFCCDGAYEWAKCTLKIDETLGDFDSLDYLPDPPPKEVYPSEKDYTDGELALLRAIERGYSKVEIYGGGGGREDHFLGNLHLLYEAADRGVTATLITNYSRIFVGEGEVRLSGEKGKTVSLLPFGDRVHILEYNGFYYPLPKVFSYGSTLGISNVVTNEEARLVVEGRLLVIVNHKEPI